MSSEQGEWWKAFYDDLLAEVLLERNEPEEVARTAAYLERTLGLQPGDRVFDQCCGTGRLSIPLAQSGYEVTGFDLMPDYVARARAKAEDAGVQVELFAADAFEFSRSGAFAAGLNWWTSFGYAATDRENLCMLQCAHESLRPGGRFALDFMNTPGVLRHFQPEVVTKATSDTLGEIELVRRSRVDVAAGVMNKTWTYRTSDGRVTKHESSVRMYDPPALCALFEAAGFSNVQVHGDLDGSAITLDSPRCIVSGERVN